MQRQLSDSAGWLSSLTGSGDQATRLSAADSSNFAASEAALELHQKEIADLQVALKESRRDLEKCARERAEEVAQNAR